MTKPMRPADIPAAKKAIFPPAVFEAFNELITRHFSDGEATFELQDAVKLISEKMTLSHAMATAFRRGMAHATGGEPRATDDELVEIGNAAVKSAMTHEGRTLADLPADLRAAKRAGVRAIADRVRRELLEERTRLQKRLDSTQGHLDDFMGIAAYETILRIVAEQDLEAALVAGLAECEALRQRLHMALFSEDGDDADPG